jgi:hypothetical protein
VVLRNGRLIQGTVRQEAEQVVVRVGALDYRWPRQEVLGIALDAQTVRQLRRQQLKDDDWAGRLELARWLMFQGLREQALAEARDVMQANPSQRAAQELVRTLEQSLQQFPPAGKTTVVPSDGRLLTDWAKGLDLTTEGILTFASRAQPILLNQCVDCHARPDYQGSFRLKRVSGLEMGGPNLWYNLQAVAQQLNRELPEQSPLLVQALRAHGGMKQPAFVSRQSPGYKTLEAWVRTAVPPAAPPMIPPAQSSHDLLPPPPPPVAPKTTGSHDQPVPVVVPVNSPPLGAPLPMAPLTPNNPADHGR